jgi:uncharacterized membrane protein
VVVHLVEEGQNSNMANKRTIIFSILRIFLWSLIWILVGYKVDYWKFWALIILICGLIILKGGQDE